MFKYINLFLFPLFYLIFFKHRNSNDVYFCYLKHSKIMFLRIDLIVLQTVNYILFSKLILKKTFTGGTIFMLLSCMSDDLWI